MKKRISATVLALALGAGILSAAPAQAVTYDTWYSMSYSVKQRCVDAVGWKAFEYRQKGYQTISFACVSDGAGHWYGKVMYGR